MIKYLKGAGWYFPADNVLAIDTASDGDNAIVHVKDENGTAEDALLTATGTSAAAQGANYAEALIEEINFGKQVVIDLTTVHYETDGTAFTAAKT
jgi:hypothetical protein